MENPVKVETSGEIVDSVITILKKSTRSTLKVVEGTIYVHTADGPLILVLSHNHKSDDLKFENKPYCTRPSSSNNEIATLENSTGKLVKERWKNPTKKCNLAENKLITRQNDNLNNKKIDENCGNCNTVLSM